MNDPVFAFLIGAWIGGVAMFGLLSRAHARDRKELLDGWRETLDHAHRVHAMNVEIIEEVAKLTGINFLPAPPPPAKEPH